MTRRTVVPRVEPVHADELPDPCRWCTYWELRKGQEGQRVSGPQARAAQEAKQDWWRAAALEWGPVGYAARTTEGTIGFMLVGPAHRFPRTALLGGTSPDALFLAQLWTSDPGDESTAAALLRSALLLAGSRGQRAVEAFASVAPTASCHPPARRLLEHGFVEQRWDARYPLLRLDLRQAPGLLARVREALGRVRLPAPRAEEVPSAPTSST